jgi:hypothetical protein
LGDVLSRIPTHYLKHGTPDPKRELRFRINDLSSDIARGRAAVPLSRIAQLVPDIFVKEIGRDEDTEVRLPLQKLVEQIGLLRSRPKAPPVEKLTRPTPSLDAFSPVQEARVLSSAPVAKEIPTPAANPSIATPAPAPLVLGEPALPAQRSMELKPAAVQPTAPVILGPPPAAEPPPILAVPVVPVVPDLPVSAPELRQPAPPFPEPVKPEDQPIIQIDEITPPAPTAPTEHPAAPEPATIVIDWGAVAEAKAPESSKEPEPVEVEIGKTEPVEIEPAKVEAPKVEAPKVEAPKVEAPKVEEPARIEPANVESATARSVTESIVDTPHEALQKTSSVEWTELEAGEEKIHLSLAAILRHCPPEIVVGGLPQVGDNVHITLPFAPIDRQLVKGHVEVSAIRFIAALPEIYKSHFVPKVGVKVPIPLEEVFQNLPSSTHEVTPSAGGSPPVVLAPPVAGEATPATPPATEKPAPFFILGSPLQAEPLEAKAAEVVSPPVEPASSETPAPAKAPTVEPLFGNAQNEGKPSANEEKIAHTPAFSIVPPPTPVQPAKPERPVIDLPTPVIVEKTPEARPASSDRPPVPVPPIPFFAKSEPAKEVPPVAPLVAETEIPEVPVHAPAPATPAPSVPAAHEAPAASAVEVPKLVLQPPTFRPFVVPPPPIFGFTPPPSAAESTPEPAPVEPPSLISALVPPPVSETISESVSSPLDTPASLAPSDGEPGAEAVGAETILPAVSVQPAPVSNEAAPIALPVEPEAQPPVSATPPPLEPVAPPANDFEPSAELIASAPEDAASATFGPQAAEQVPFADVADTLAIETTYADAHAEVVHIDEPYTRSAEPAKTEPAAQVISESVTAEASVAVEAPAQVEQAAVASSVSTAPEAPTVESPAPVIEELAAAAGTVAAAEIVAKASEPGAQEAAPTEPFEEEEKSTLGEEVEEPNLPSRSAAPLPPTPVLPLESVAEVPQAPHPLFPVPRHPVEHTPMEILPPPSLPLRRFDQDAVQALFMTEEALDLPKISRLAAGLPGVYACVIATRDQACTGGTLPEGFDLAALLGLAPRVGEAAGRMPIGALKHFTLYGEAYSVSFFERQGVSVCAVHRPRSFVPGVREKLVALADELSR